MHSLRKVFGRRYADKVPAQELQRLMRHRDICTTMDYYANVDAAVEEAVFRPKVNSSLNRDKTEIVNERAGSDANTERDGRSDAKC